MRKRTLNVTRTDDKIILEWLDTKQPFLLHRLITYIKERIELICWSIAWWCSWIIIISFALYVIINI